MQLHYHAIRTDISHIYPAVHTGPVMDWHHILERRIVSSIFFSVLNVICQMNTHKCKYMNLFYRWP